MPRDDVTTAAVEPGTEPFGFQVEPLTPDLAERLNVPDARGLVVTDVAAGSPADAAGLRRGDVILEVARQPVSDVAALRRALDTVPAGDPALLYVHRPGGEGRKQYLVLAPAPRP
jgi:S1-C subfamily serine protease